MRREYKAAGVLGDVEAGQEKPLPESHLLGYNLNRQTKWNV